MAEAARLMARCLAEKAPGAGVSATAGGAGTSAAAASPAADAAPAKATP
jgi:hypothetical protein